MRAQTITLENGIKVIIDHDSKEKCPHCKSAYWDKPKKNKAKKN